MEFTEAEARAAIGPRHEYYIGQWRQTQRRRFNRAAFWFSGAWLPFRRMYLATIIFYVAILALDLAVNAVLGQPLNQQQLVARGAACTVIAATVCGIWGSRWYRAHVARLIQTVRALNLPADEHLRQLEAVGGTRPIHAIGAILFFAVASWVIDKAGM